MSEADVYPFGDEITSTSNDREKFATYTRDSYTGLDYADQRYFASTYGRFNTTDPYRKSATSRNPLSWNRYAYVGGDPINMNDPTGRCGQSDGILELEQDGSGDPDPSCWLDPSGADVDLPDGPIFDSDATFTATGGASASDSDSDSGDETSDGASSSEPPCIQDVTPIQGQQIINNASKFLGAPYGYGPGQLVCAGLACLAIRPFVPSFPEGKASTWGTHNNLRQLGPNEPRQPGDIIRYPGHVGLYDPGHAPNPVLSATGHGVRWTPILPFFGNPLGFSRLQVPCN